MPFLKGNAVHHEAHSAELSHSNTELMAFIGLAMRAADKAMDIEAFWDFLL
ncbi:hypothetical protein ETB97_009675 [Aspergillus alliaceus]|uniref:Uncharacterized protein n=1 Tax=Petromyces alliaceus TaxID=209559 RepID=A0A8H5ZRS5_PETAA|nr:hypothetical protein ETB97_009675 [Aspergillus burnettii]